MPLHTGSDCHNDADLISNKRSKVTFGKFSFHPLISRSRPAAADQRNVITQQGGDVFSITSNSEAAGIKLTTIQLGLAKYELESDRLIGPAGDEIMLRWQSAQVLQILANALGNLTSRDDIIEAVWQGVAVTDDSLTQCIADIRRAIADHDHAILKTLRKRGYVLSGTILAPEEEPISTALPELRLAPAQAQGLMESRAPFEHAAQEPMQLLAQLDPRDILPTLAVLPMLGLAGSHTDPLGNFISDEISGALSRSPDINVISRLSTRNLGHRSDEIGKLRNMLNTDFVLSGVLHTQRDKTVLSLEFVDTSNNFVLWSDRMVMNAEEVLNDTSWVDRVVALIGRAIMINEMRKVHSLPIENLKLFSVLHGAIGLMHRFSPQDFSKAREHLNFVASQAPTSPVPLAWLARWHVLRTVQGWTDNAAREVEDALSFTARALDLDPENTLALVCEGQVLAHLAHRFDDAQDRYDTALASNPNDANGLALRGILGSFQDKGAEGKRDAERAIHLTPLDPHRFFYLILAAAANLSAEEYPRAEKLAKESLRLNRTHVSTLRTLTVAQVGAGRVDEARKTAQELIRQQPDISVNSWLQTSPSAGFENGKRFAKMLLIAGIPN